MFALSLMDVIIDVLYCVRVVILMSVGKVKWLVSVRVICGGVCQGAPRRLLGTDCHWDSCNQRVKTACYVGPESPVEFNAEDRCRMEPILRDPGWVR